MGKCLSCCSEPNESIHIGSRTPKNGDNRTELNFVEGVLDHRHHHHHHHRRRRSIESSVVDTASFDRRRCRQTNNSNGKSVAACTATGTAATATATTTTTASEKRMFYPRIPPILSGGGTGEGKRSSSSRDSASETKIVALYDQYRDTNEDAILSEGIERFCHDLEVKPEEFKVLLLAWKFNAETMCRFTRHEFVSGCKCLKVSSIRGIQNRFADMMQEVQDLDRFKDLYRFTFKFGLDTELGQRILPTDMAVSLWKLVFSQKEPPILKRWLAFLEKHPNVRGIPFDTWNMFLNFLEAIGEDLSSYDDTEAWPSLFDDFVEYENDQTNQNIHPINAKSMEEEEEEQNGFKNF